MYFPLRRCCRHGMLLELKYLSVVESGLNPEALTGRGPWSLAIQYYTAKVEGLHRRYIDERKDPLLATEAACRHLRRAPHLRRLVLRVGGLQCGPGNVNKAIRRSGGKTNYWEIRPFAQGNLQLRPQFHRGGVPDGYHAAHGIFPKNPLPGGMAADTLHVQGPLRFDQMAAVTGLSESEVAALNPMYRLQIVPGPGEKFL